ncbi:protein DETOXIFICATION 16-like [Nicotiana sylvestris]|uniref:protein DETOXIFICATION 16-like n=1 Tax=Nicotiana sylvestris TaxID=4096 RepID=UPI00388C9179
MARDADSGFEGRGALLDSTKICFHRFASAVLSSLLTLNIKLSHFVFCETKFVGKTDIQERKQDLEECPQVPNSRNERKSDEFFEEVKKLLALAGPLMLVNLLLYFLQVISLMFVGHLGELALSGASLATSFAFVTGYSLLVGMGSALETLCGQSYGALHHYMLGIHMQRAMFVSLLIISIPIVCIWANAGHILVILKQDPEIAAEAGLYARFMIPSIFAYGLLECQIRFLQAQNNVRPMMLSTGITLLLHVFSCWIFVLKTGLGSKGAALANATSYWINVFLLAAYVRISPSCKSTWTGFSTKAFTDIPRYLRLAIPSALMICLEIWSFELMVTLCGLLPNPKLETSVLSISLNTSVMLHMLAEGLGGATSVRVSNELGAGQPKAARLAARTATILATIEGILLAIIMVSIRNVWGHCYSNEEDVVIYVGKMLILHSSLLTPEPCSGIARGCGCQKKGAFVNLGAYYLWGIPAGVVLAFVYHLGGKGLWLGIILAHSAQALIYLVVILLTDWDKQAMKAAERVTQESAA